MAAAATAAAGLIPASRVAIGAHSVPQVVAGFAVGVLLSAASALAIYQLLNRIHFPPAWLKR